MNGFARTFGRALVLGAALALAPPSSGTARAQAQTDTLAQTAERQTLAALREVVEERYQVLTVQDGILLIPKYGDTEVQSVELSNGDIAVNGEAVTGAELRGFVADDTDAILRLSYLDTETRRVLFGIGAPPPVAPSDTVTADTTAVAEREERRGIDARSEGDRVRIGGSVTVREGERIDGDVVAVGGNVSVYGTVDGDVSAVGGTVRLGSDAVVHGDVTAAGGRVIREPGAEVHGRISETSFGAPDIRVHRGLEFTPFEGMAGFIGTVMWIIFLGLLTAMVYLLARRPVERMEYRATTTPWKAGAVGLAAQILFLPALAIATVVLVISIVGIPLLIAIPFAILALAIGILIGFTAVAKAVGSAAEERLGWAHASRYVTIMVGVGLIMAISFFAAALGIAGGPLGFFATILAILGFVIQYVAWTIGLGALLLTRFGTRYSWGDEGPGAAPVTAPAAPPEPVPAEPPPPETPRG